MKKTCYERNETCYDFLKTEISFVLLIPATRFCGELSKAPSICYEKFTRFLFIVPVSMKLEHLIHYYLKLSSVTQHEVRLNK